MSPSTIQPFEPSACFRGAYRNKRVLITGHTGFKGAWLCEWLCHLGAHVTGFALEPIAPALFLQLQLAGRVEHVIGDIRERALIAETVRRVRPDFVFHLAAQPLVRLSYETPVETYEINVMGTVNVLDALRTSLQPVSPSILQPSPCAAVFITTDKCYENREWFYAYREKDPLGGYDPYSSSKAAAEIAIAAFRRSYSPATGNPLVKIASARAGNVIGGGDWALDRIVPDAMRALSRGERISVRNKLATRPWQHVLEPLSGYLWLGALLHRPELLPRPSSAELASAFNFGPPLGSNRAVAELVEEILKQWPGEWVDQSDPNAVHEAGLLNLAADKAHHLLDWQAVWSFEETVAQTVQWYAAVADQANPITLTQQQIDAYSLAANRLGRAWATS